MLYLLQCTLIENGFNYCMPHLRSQIIWRIDETKLCSKGKSSRRPTYFNITLESMTVFFLYSPRGVVYRR